MNVDTFNQLSTGAQGAVEEFARILATAEKSKEYGKFGVEITLQNGKVCKNKYFQELTALTEEKASSGQRRNI